MEYTKLPSTAPPDYIKDAPKLSIDEEHPPKYDDALLESQQKEYQGFKTGVFECMADPSMVASSVFCLPCLFGSTSKYLDHIIEERNKEQQQEQQQQQQEQQPEESEQENKDLEASQTTWLHPDTFYFGFIIAAGIPLVTNFFGGIRRQIIRNELNLSGPNGKSTGQKFRDMGLHLCLPVCAIAQENIEVRRHYRELRVQKAAERQLRNGMMVPDMTEQYKMQQKMGGSF